MIAPNGGTAVAAILLRETLANPGWQTGVFAHERAAVKNLFDLVKRFVDNLPEEHRPEIGASNAEALAFSKIDSGYTVSVPTEAGSGRSSTLQLIHGSEVAFWPNLLELLAALVQARLRRPTLQTTGLTMRSCSGAVTRYASCSATRIALLPSTPRRRRRLSWPACSTASLRLRT
jgi:hypothetical protein